MATYRITAPDGGEYEITAPDDATQEQVLAYAQQNYQAASQPAAKPSFAGVTTGGDSVAAGGRPDFSGATTGVASTESAASTPGNLTIAGAGPGVSRGQFGQFVRNQQAGHDPQAFAAAEKQSRQQAFRTSPAIGRFAAGVGSRVENAAVGLGQLVGATDQQSVEAMRQRQAFMDGDLAASAGKIAGDLGLLAVPGGAVNRLASGTARFGGNVALGGAWGGMQPVGEGESRAVNAAVGAAAGGAGDLVGRGLAAAGNRAAQAVDPIRKSLVAVAKRENIPLHLSQVSQSVPAKTAASVSKYLPFSGAGRAAQNQQQAFNTSVSRTFGADAPKLTDDVMTDARRRLSAQFEDIYNRNNIPFGGDTLRKLVNVETETAKRLTVDEARIVSTQLDDIVKELGDGVLTGQKYQALRTSIMKAEGPDKVGSAVKELRKALDDIAADAVGPADAEALRVLRSQWANFRTAENVLKQVAGAAGDIKPASLWPAIRKGSTKEMRELARLGQVMLKDPIPDSGTQGRLVMGSLMTGGAGVGGLGVGGLAGLLALGPTVGRALNSNALARLAAQHAPGSTRNALARFVPASGLLAAPVVADEIGNNGR